MIELHITVVDMENLHGEIDKNATPYPVTSVYRLEFEATSRDRDYLHDVIAALQQQAVEGGQMHNLEDMT